VSKTHNGSPVPISPVWTAVTIRAGEDDQGIQRERQRIGDRRAFPVGYDDTEDWL